MPRKKKTTLKRPLQFREAPLGGSRLQDLPEVRAAVNPKSFIGEGQSPNRSACNSWVSPQFDQLAVAAAPVRRGRRTCQSTTSVLDRFSQLSRKSTACKFPQLSFERRTRDQSLQAKQTRGKKTTASAALAGPADQPQGSCQINSTISHTSAQYVDTPKRQSSLARKRNVGDSDGTASSSRRLDALGAPSIGVTGTCIIPAPSALTPPLTELRTPNVSSVLTPPDVDTPEVPQEGSVCPSSFPFPHLLLPPCQASTPPHDQTADVLVADTPERDYGLKVTWRRRRALMMMLKEKGYLSDSDVLIHS
ncbi:RAD9, HUS1, RAD1-interacting nuclear orphan protein 1 [Myripristis murdjan]|uniref:RAD9-HUS1-RAD1 interacting nuclear orphan 1 n=1 Tax=Myripristis murdjan TaxID=586833 RepID=A0A668A7N6_9TELE|nr:RAD9, HUS1, RAD1-interacting nuclear orphan protein 1 [Myripristis murdjan]